MIASVYARHFRCGSGATPTMMSRGRSGDCAMENSVRAGLEAHVGTGEAEVIELLGVDLGELLGVDGRGEIACGRGGGFGRVVPAREGHDQNRSPEALRHRVNLQRVHSWTPPRTLTSSLSRVPSVDPFRGRR